MSAIALFNEEQLARAHRRQNSTHPELWNLLDQIVDPEIPVISIWDLGVLQDVRYESNEVTVVITPTYSACPAMGAIADDIKACLTQAGYGQVEVQRRLAPVWDTDWLSTNAKQQLFEYGIAPPLPRHSENKPSCPQCKSQQVALISEFGSTACKALYKCSSCLEPFDYFKCL